MCDVRDGQHDCQASVGSKCFALQFSSHACRVVCHSRYPLCALAPLLINETVFLLSERQDLAHKSACPSVICPEPEVADLDGELPFLCGLVTCVIVTLALVVLLRYRRSSRVEPAALRVRRVRLDHNEDVRTEKSTLLSPGSRIVVSCSSKPFRFFERKLERYVGWALVVIQG